MAVLSCCRAVGWRLSCYGRQVFARVGLSLIQTNSSSNFFYFGSVLVQTKPQRCPRQSFALSATSPRRLRPSFGHRTACVPSDAYDGLYLRPLCSWYRNLAKIRHSGWRIFCLILYDKSVFINLNVFARASYNARTFAESMYI